jgi:hypothetical protein
VRRPPAPGTRIWRQQRVVTIEEHDAIDQVTTR